MPYFGSNWHYHEDYELLFTIRGGGIRIVGDNMNHYGDNELVFIGRNLPHLFKNEENNEPETVDYIVVRFNDLFSEQSFFSIPEFSQISQFLKLANRGIIFSKETTHKISKQIIKLSESAGADRIINLMIILKTLSNEKYFQLLASETFSLKSSTKGEERIQKVINYITDNYMKDLTLVILSEMAFMTTNSFCRYFKARTGKTVFQFIRQFRVNKACQMLINGEKSISDICFDTGFNSLSTFNRIFKSLTSISASEYKSKYLKLNS
jgi:AraC-like DNA-binding protein